MTRFGLRAFAWSLVVFGYGCLARPVTAQFEVLATKVPAAANAIVLLDGQQLLASPLAEKEGWKQKYEQAFASGGVTIPPDTEHMILAAQLDYQRMQPLWEVVLADFSAAHTAADIARTTGGALDTIGEFPAVPVMPPPPGIIVVLPMSPVHPRPSRDAQQVAASGNNFRTIIMFRTLRAAFLGGTGRLHQSYIHLHRGRRSVMSGG